MGLSAIGRPSNTGGAAHLAALCATMDVIVVGENDGRLVEGKGIQVPGQDGAESVATSLAQQWDRAVKVTMPPRPLKDIRQWFNARVADSNDQELCGQRGTELLEYLHAGVREVKPPPPQLDIQIDRKPNRTKITVTARVNGHIVHVDELSPASDRRRKDFAKQVVAKEPRLTEDAVEKSLLKTISEPDETITPPVAPTRESLLEACDEKTQQFLDETPAEIIDQAEALLLNPNLLNVVQDHLVLVGVVGEAELAFTTYLIGVSRLLPAPDLPLAGIAQGMSSTGKSYVMDRVSTLFPPEAILKATDITAQALFYMPKGALMHRWVVAGERPRVQDDERAEATRALREMIASGCLSKAVTMKLQGALQTVRLEQFGPIAYTESTTLTKIFDEDANRCVILQTDESSAQTRRIMKAKAYLETQQAPDVSPIQAVHHAMQRLLMRVRVQVPFAELLADALPAERPEARRAFNHTLALIKSVALLHQRQRVTARLSHGDVVQATPVDYRIAKRLLEGPLSRSLGGSIPVAVANLGRRLSSGYGGEVFTTAQAVKDDPVLKHRGKMNEYLNTLEFAGVVNQVEPSRGSKPASWKVIGEVPASGANWLPDPDVLEERRV